MSTDHKSKSLSQNELNFISHSPRKTFDFLVVLILIIVTVFSVCVLNHFLILSIEFFYFGLITERDQSFVLYRIVHPETGCMWRGIESIYLYERNMWFESSWSDDGDYIGTRWWSIHFNFFCTNWYRFSHSIKIIRILFFVTHLDLIDRKRKVWKCGVDIDIFDWTFWCSDFETTSNSNYLWYNSWSFGIYEVLNKNLLSKRAFEIWISLSLMWYLQSNIHCYCNCSEKIETKMKHFQELSILSCFMLTTPIIADWLLRGKPYRCWKKFCCNIVETSMLWRRESVSFGIWPQILQYKKRSMNIISRISFFW